MLIIEGSDCVGKTTLCNELLKRLNAAGCAMIPQHFGLLPKDWGYYADYLPYMATHTVMDRFIMSEVVYGHTLRGGSPLTPEIYRLLDAHLRMLGAVTVVVVANDYWYRLQLKEKYGERRQVFDVDQVTRVNKGFMDLVYRDDPVSTWVLEYSVDFDYTYECNQGNGYPASNETFLSMVTQTYLRRHRCIKVLRGDVCSTC